MSTYKHLRLFYWSGTGNSYRIAREMLQYGNDRNLKTELIPIEDLSIIKKDASQQQVLTGIVFPTHGFTAPWHIIKNVLRMSRGNSSHVFCTSTRAGLKFGKVFTPGISGSATFLLALILILKGYSVQGLISIDMPSNWFSFHPIQSSISHKAIIERAKYKTEKFISKIMSGGRVFFTLNNLYEFLWGAVLSLISLGYLLFGRFYLAKLFFANNHCNGCGVCADHCSVNAIEMWGKKHPRPFWKYNCESCMRCAAFCPKNAIEAGHSWAVLLYLISSVSLTAWLFSRLGDSVPLIADLKVSGFATLVDIFYFYPAIFISYIVFSLLMRISFLNRIFTYTTMTHFSFWGRYREPDVKLKDLIKKKITAL